MLYNLETSHTAEKEYYPFTDGRDVVSITTTVSNSAVHLFTVD